MIGYLETLISNKLHGFQKTQYITTQNLLSNNVFSSTYFSHDRLCGLMVRVPGYRSRGPGFDSRRYHIFWEVVSLERCPLSCVSITEELLEWKSSGLESRKSRWNISTLTFGTNYITILKMEAACISETSKYCPHPYIVSAQIHHDNKQTRCIIQYHISMLSFVSLSAVLSYTSQPFSGPCISTRAEMLIVL
jgi:hypothetical protein